MPELPWNDRNQPPDYLAKTALRTGALTVDPVAGAVYRWYGRKVGERAERLHNKTAYGQVVVARPDRLAMAHRVIWISVNGLIPAGIEINHSNLRRWDNRLDNLEAVLPEGNQRHWRGQWYARVPGPQWQEFVAAAREDSGDERAYDPYNSSGSVRRVGRRGSAYV